MNDHPVRAASLTAGVSLAAMAVISPLVLLVALPAGDTGAAALMVLVVSTLDVVIGVALYPVLAPAGGLLAGCAAALRVAYGAVFATAAGSLVGAPDVERFHAVWDMALFLFGVHLVVVGVAMARAHGLPTWVGILTLISGLGYVVDAASAAVAPAAPLTVAQVAFVGEVVLLIWLIGWGGRPLTTRQGR